MGLAPAAHVLFNKHMRFNPSNPKWLNRDRFVLSYVLRHLLSNRILSVASFGRGELHSTEVL